MRIGITGSSGLVGSALRRSLEADGHQAVAIRRTGTHDWERGGLEGLDGLVHLAGAGIADKRWNAERKREILESRTIGTANLVAALGEVASKPAVLVSGSAVGYYGPAGDEALTEDSPPGTDFLAELCVGWEAAGGKAEALGIRTCFARTGIVQTGDGGPLAKQLLLFKLGLGGKLGSGQQWLSWIALADEVGAIRHLLDHDTCRGPYNLTAPNPVTNLTYTKALGAALHRPTFLPIPAFGPKLLLGKELAENLLYTGQRVLPTRLQAAGYAFQLPTIDEAFAAIL